MSRNLILILNLYSTIITFSSPIFGKEVSESHIQVDSHMKNTSKTFGSSIRIKCEISGDPIPSYFWLKDGVALDPLRDDRFQIQTTYWGSRLRMEDLNFSDEGVYSCEGKNEAGSANTSAYVLVVQGAVKDSSNQSSTKAQTKDVDTFDLDTMAYDDNLDIVYVDRHPIGVEQNPENWGDGGKPGVAQNSEYWKKMSKFDAANRERGFGSSVEAGDWGEERQCAWYGGKTCHNYLYNQSRWVRVGGRMNTQELDEHLNDILSKLLHNDWLCIQLIMTSLCRHAYTECVATQAGQGGTVVGQSGKMMFGEKSDEILEGLDETALDKSGGEAVGRAGTRCPEDCEALEKPDCSRAFEIAIRAYKVKSQKLADYTGCLIGDNPPIKQNVDAACLSSKNSLQSRETGWKPHYAYVTVSILISLLLIMSIIIVLLCRNRNHGNRVKGIQKAQPTRQTLLRNCSLYSGPDEAWVKTQAVKAYVADTGPFYAAPCQHDQDESQINSNYSPNTFQVDVHLDNCHYPYPISNRENSLLDHVTTHRPIRPLETGYPEHMTSQRPIKTQENSIQQNSPLSNTTTSTNICSNLSSPTDHQRGLTYDDLIPKCQSHSLYLGQSHEDYVGQCYRDPGKNYLGTNYIGHPNNVVQNYAGGQGHGHFCHCRNADCSNGRKQRYGRGSPEACGPTPFEALVGRQFQWPMSTEGGGVEHEHMTVHAVL